MIEWPGAITPSRDLSGVDSITERSWTLNPPKSRTTNPFNSFVSISNRASTFCGCASNATPLAITEGRKAAKNNSTNLIDISSCRHQNNHRSVIGTYLCSQAIRFFSSSRPKMICAKGASSLPLYPVSTSAVQTIARSLRFASEVFS